MGEKTKETLKFNYLVTRFEEPITMAAVGIHVLSVCCRLNDGHHDWCLLPRSRNGLVTLVVKCKKRIAVSGLSKEFVVLTSFLKMVRYGRKR